MSRWEPNARERLEQAAMELYAERGFDETTVAEIAERAGLTERTFFRYFADKREVLFSGATALQERFTTSVANAPEGATPLDSVIAALGAVAPIFEERRAFARRRQALIVSHAELRERELIKLASLAEAIAAALRLRGVPEPAASVTAESGITVFKVAFQLWTGDRAQRPLTHHIRDSLEALQVVTKGNAGADTTPPKTLRTTEAPRPKRLKKPKRA